MVACFILQKLSKLRKFETSLTMINEVNIKPIFFHLGVIISLIIFSILLEYKKYDYYSNIRIQN